MTHNDDPNTLDTVPPARVVLTRAEAVEILGLRNDASLQRLVERGELVPLTFTRPFVFAVVEIHAFVDRQLSAERKRRSVSR